MQKQLKKISVLVHGGEDIFRHGIIQIVSSESNFEIVGVTESSNLVELVRVKQPDIVFTTVDVDQPDIAAAINAITENFPNTAFVVACRYDQDQLLVEALRAGAKGFLLRSAEKREVIDAIANVYKIGYYYSRPIGGKLANILTNPELKKFALDGVPRMGEKDKTFIQLFCKGFSMKQIAAATGVTRYAVQARRKQLYRKLDFKTAMDVVNYAILNGLYNPHLQTC